MQMLNLARIAHLSVFSCFLLLCGNLSAQSLEVKFKVEKNRISVKWLPSDYETLLALRNGAEVSRIEAGNKENLSNLDYSNGKKWLIAPLDERYNRLDENDLTESSYALLLEPIMVEVSDSAERNFAFGSNVIMNVTDPEVQKVLGNFIEDIDFNPRKQYAYEIRVASIDPVYVYVDANEITVYPEVNVSLYLDQKKTVVCSWNYEELRDYSFAFDIDHAVGKTTNAAPLLENPFMPFHTTDMANTDSTQVRHNDPKKGEWHYYKVTGRDAFGAPKLESDWFSIYVPDRIDAFPIIDSMEVQGTSRIIRGSVTGARNNVDQISLFRSKQRESGFELLETRDFDGDSVFSFPSEVSVPSGDAYYYKVALLNEDDTVASLPYYFFTLDQEPPAPPSNLNVAIDSNGIATLNWSAPEDTDIRGYRVFRGNQKSEEFVEQTQNLRLETEFMDTLRLDNLSSKVYYYVQTVDNNYNNSAHSDTILALKPDTIAPVPSLIRSVKMTEKGIELRLIPSTSEDVSGTELYRNEKALGSVGDSFLDTTVVAGKFYAYYLKTSDLSGNSSRSKTISQKYEPGIRRELTAEAKVNLGKKCIEITWQLPVNEEVYAVKIYKAKSGNPLRLWKTITDYSKNKIEDNTLYIGEEYVYTVSYITQDGIASVPVRLEVLY